MTALVPFVDLHAQTAALRGELTAAISEVLDRGDYIRGHDVDAFEHEFAAYCGARHCVGVNSGTAALILALRALDLGAGDEVLVPANTFAATAFAVLEAGATPVLVDPDPDTCVVTAAALEAAITPRTRALLPVHLYGRLAPMAEICELAAHRGLQVVEDAAQAHGAQHDGVRAGAFGDAAGFSFYPSKNLGAFGDGGAVTCRDGRVADAVRRLGNLGAEQKYLHEVVGPNERLDTLQAAVLRVKLAHLDRWNAAREATAAAYDEALAATPLRRPAPAPPGAHVYHLYVVFCETERDREGLREHLASAGVQTGLHYPVPLPELPALRGRVGPPEAYPVACAQARTGLSLPMYAELTRRQVHTVTEAIARFFS